ncbi:ComEC/Rec2 family competence protein [Paraburkholderia phymatum]|uniref:DNA internalization-related competence protein ComEC/Rec2 n=1 Tax=Paraburkholderia phymatum (strain DSM 17167 / CIP 108236 / LMG 21445 / STM815) TaxID=391038 RepID=B2JIX4_PARP8|nr:ComEC/Rec2 family competence protein [Paraburkholderia phymatum]ACC70625.1 DNA internalization-related competence protein ComEC/Rec2 [Paraburkholderia phymatum STM815]
MRAVWCGFAVGVVWLQQQPALPGWLTWLVLAASACALAVVARLCFRRGTGWFSRAGWFAVLVAAACAGFGYGAWRAQTRLAFELPREWEGRDIVVRGWVKGLPTRSADGARFLFAVEAADVPVERFPRTLQLSWIANDTPPPALEPGSRWRLNVRLKRPHGNANWGVRDAEAALLARDIRATGYVNLPLHALRLRGKASGVGVTVDGLRSAIRNRIAAVLADAPHMGVVMALAIGAQDAVSTADWQLMRRTGTSHLVAISGLHIGFVAGLAGWLTGMAWRRSLFVGRNWPLLVPAQKVSMASGALFAAFHAALAGFNVPAQRTLWMAAIAALSYLGGRRVAPSVVLAWALGLVLLVDPWAVVSAGFWLSFCAVGAILFAMSGHARIARNTSRDAGLEEGERTFVMRCGDALRLCIGGLNERIRSGARVQLAVTIALAPLTVCFFSQIPLIGPFANAFAIPWVSVLVTPAVIAGVALPAPFDALAFRAAHHLLECLVAGLQLFSSAAWTLWPLPQPSAWALASAGVGVAWCLAPPGWPLRWAAPLTWLPLLAPASGAPAEGAFRLTALDIGQGSSIVVETAHHALLFDAGPGPESTHAGERIVVPYLQAAGIDALDTLVISHADSDHSGGALAVLDSVEVRQLLAALPPTHPLWHAARGKGAQTVRCAAGQRWQWDGVDFAMLWPSTGPLQGKPNAHCCVLRIGAAGVSQSQAQVRTHMQTHTAEPQPVIALLAADIEAPVERTLLARERAALRAQILLVPHHGSKTSSTEPFLDAIDPSIAVFQVGYRNRFHHPYAGVYARYQARGIELTRSDDDGAGRIEASGAGLSLERYRQTHRRYWMDR